MDKESQISTKRVFGIMLPIWVDEKLLNQVVVTFVGIVIMLLSSMLFIWPNFTEVSKLQSRIDTLTKTVDQYEESQTYLDNFVSKLGEGDIERLSLVLPDAFVPEFILASLRKLTSDSGVNLVTYSMKGGEIGDDSDSQPSVPGKKQEILTFRPHLVKAVFSGESRSLVGFLDKLESSYPYCIVSKLTLSEVSKMLKSKGVVNLNLELTYYNSTLADVAGLKMESFTDQDYAWVKKINTFSGPSILVKDGVDAEELQTDPVSSVGTGLFGD